ncbi:MAG: DUF424 family protein [Nanoarchaeota archaeon]
MWIKIHKSYRTTVAICDDSLLGKRFEEGVKQLDVRESFYNGQQINKKDLIELIRREAKEDATFNIVGKESIKAAVEAGLIGKNSWKKVQRVPFVLVLI